MFLNTHEGTEKSNYHVKKALNSSNLGSEDNDLNSSGRRHKMTSDWVKIWLELNKLNHLGSNLYFGVTIVATVMFICTFLFCLLCSQFGIWKQWMNDWNIDYNSGILKQLKIRMKEWLLHLISVPPPVGDLTFSSFNTPKNWHSTGQYFHNIWAYPWRIWVPPLKNFVKMKASPLENSIFFYFTPKEILNFYNLFPKNSIVAQLGWREVRILNAIAQ